MTRSISILNVFSISTVQHVTQILPHKIISCAAFPLLFFPTPAAESRNRTAQSRLLLTRAHAEKAQPTKNRLLFFLPFLDNAIIVLSRRYVKFFNRKKNEQQEHQTALH